jgi:hypothetical protein
MTRVARSDAEIRLIKNHLCDVIASGVTPLRAHDDMGLSYSTTRFWRKADPTFDQAYTAAVEALTDRKADELLTVHEDVDDPKQAKVASDNLKWWLERRNSKEFGPKVQPADSQPQLLGILQAAVQRLIEAVPAGSPRQEPLAINCEPAPRAAIAPMPLIADARVMGDDPVEAHRP